MTKRETGGSHLSVPMRRPEDVIAHLGKGVRHWSSGYSAHSLASAWFGAKGFPPAVRALLDGSDVFRGAVFVDGLFERATELGDGLEPTHTDLLVIAKRNGKLIAIGVEGKAEEPFAQLVGEWLAADTKGTRPKRLRELCAMLGFAGEPDPRLRYQLFHRAAACALEAERYGAETALLLVHSFSEKRTSLCDYRNFVTAVAGDAAALPDAITGPARCKVNGQAIELYFGWVSDTVTRQTFWKDLQTHSHEREAYLRSIADKIQRYGPKDA
ncbi:MAG TPA: hypothetical protein VII56_15895 [Rhizomicrobium sp.]